MAEEKKKEAPIVLVIVFLVVALLLAVFLILEVARTDQWSWPSKALWSAPPLYPMVRWLIAILIVLSILWAIGLARHRRLAGVFVDSRYKISLSRLQIILWTILVLSAYVAVALPRALQAEGLRGVVDKEVYLQMKEDDEKRAAACFPDAAKEIEAQEAANAALPEAERKAVQVTVADQCRDPLSINIPGELLVALGISTASLAGSVIVKSIKQGKEIDVEALRKKRQDASDELNDKEAALGRINADLDGKTKSIETLKLQLEGADESKQAQLQAAISKLQEQIRGLEEKQRQAADERDLAREKLEAAQNALDNAREAQQQGSGLLHRNTAPDQAKWLDLFRGEQVSNYEHIDMSKVQMFFFTVVLIFIYGAAVYGLLNNVEALTNPLGIDFPSFTAGMFTLLGISHAGYLTVKSVDEAEVKKE